MLHPSRYTTWSYALETPIRLRETGGGRAKWNYARLSLVLGFDDLQPNRALIDHLIERNRTLIEPIVVEDGPVHENVLTGDDIDLYAFPAPRWHHLDGGRYLGTLGCAVIFALYVVYLDIFTREAYAAEIVFYQVLVTAILGFALLPALETPLFVPRPVMIIALLYTAVFSSTVATFLQTKYQRESTPTRAAVIYSLEPVIAALFAAFLLHETLAPIAIAGAALILGGLLVSELLA